MRINHNIASLNTYRQLSANGAQTSKSLEKLSSGLRINRAGDDAAGLAISEKMRGQIRGLDQAARNSQDAISLIQTAEGALSETHSILQRMRELAVQSSNDTNTATDRKEIQKEISQLTSEINRIASATEFNKKKLLDGSISGTNGAVTANDVNGNSTFVNGGTTITGFALDAKSTAITEGDYELAVEDVQTKSIAAPTLAQQNEKSAMGISAITIATNSMLPDEDYQINFGVTTVKTVAADGAGSTLQDNIASAISVQGFSALTGNQTFAVNRVDEATYDATADATNLTGISYSGNAAIDDGAYSVVVTKEASGLANGTSAGGYVTAVDVADNTAVNGANLRMVFQERTDNDSTAVATGGASVLATDIAADNTTVLRINVAGVDYTATEAQMDAFDGLNNAAGMKALLEGMTDADGITLGTKVTVDASGAQITFDNNTGVKGDLTLTYGGTNAANLATLIGVASGTAITNNATDRGEFQVRLYDSAQSKFVSDAVILDNAQQDYDFTSGGAAIGVSFTTQAAVNTALNGANENGNYQIFDIDTKLTVMQGATELDNATLAAGTAAGKVNVAGFDINYGAVDTLAAGTASFTVDNNTSYVWGGDFGAGGNDVEVATLEGAAVDATQDLGTALDADTTLSISVDGTDFIISNAALNAYAGAGDITDLEDLIKNADTVGDGSGTKLSDIATVTNDGTKLSISGRLFGADGSIGFTVNSGDAGETAALEAAFGITDATAVTGVGGAATSFTVGDAINLAGGVSFTSSADIADYAAGGQTSIIDIDSTSGYIATLQDDLGVQVSGTSQVVVSANGSYTLGEGVSFTTGAGPLAAGNATFTVDSATTVNATLTQTSGGTYTETLEDISASSNLSFAGGVTANIAGLTNGTALFTVDGSVSDDSLSMQIGANNGQSFSIGVDDMRANALGISGSRNGVAAVAGARFTNEEAADVTNGANAEWALDVSTAANATAAIEVIDESITAVSAERSKLGAYQNRLEHTINNLGTSAENLTAAESRIRDVDMAKEMMEFTKNNILSQAAQAMLAQANQQPQGVLQLLR